MNEIAQLLKDLNELNEGTWADLNHNDHQDKPLQVTIKPEALDTSKLEEGEGNKTIFRPSDFHQYIGQENAKDKIRTKLAGCKKFNEPFPHTFLYGRAGFGKTSLAYIIASKLGLPMVQCVGGDLKREQVFVDKIVECQGGILFIDEIHKLNNRVGNFMLPILEDFQIEGQYLKPFTVIGATTEKGELTKHLKPLLQRFQLSLELENYKDDELVKILQQYKNKKYPNEKVETSVYFKIAENCQNTPRLAINLLRDYLCIEDMDKVLDYNQIIQDGITKQQLKVLDYLNNRKRASLNSISCYLQTSTQNYQYEIEPYLIAKDYIETSTGRKITEKGKLFLGKVK